MLILTSISIARISRKQRKKFVSHLLHLRNLPMLLAVFQLIKNHLKVQGLKSSMLMKKMNILLKRWSERIRSHTNVTRVISNLRCSNRLNKKCKRR